MKGKSGQPDHGADLVFSFVFHDTKIGMSYGIRLNKSDIFLEINVFIFKHLGQTDCPAEA